MEKYTLLVNRYPVSSVDEEEEDYCFDYFLAFLLPQNKRDSFFGDIAKLNHSLAQKYVRSGLKIPAKFSEILHFLIEKEKPNSLTSFWKSVTALFESNEVKIIRSNNHRDLLQKNNNGSEASTRYILYKEILAAYFEGSKCIDSLGKEGEIAEVYLNHDYQALAEEMELGTNEEVIYTDEEVGYEDLLNCLSDQSNLTLKAVNLKRKSPKTLSRFYARAASLWGKIIRPYYYDKYARFRRASAQIANFIVKKDEDN